MNTQCTATGPLSGAPLRRSGRLSRERNQNATTPRRRQNRAEGFVNASAFDTFLRWLGPDPETAGQKYESIRSRLIMMFLARRCVCPEELADATFERVAQKLTHVTDSFTGDPALYFYGVAKKIYLEYQRKITAAHSGTNFFYESRTDNEELEDMLKHLDEALNTIPKSDRELILRYYSGNKRRKITERRALAHQFGLRPNALRLRVFRIRREIKNHMLQSEVARSVLLPGPRR